jgi:hypothetical protein
MGDYIMMLGGSSFFATVIAGFIGDGQGWRWTRLAMDKVGDGQGWRWTRLAMDKVGNGYCIGVPSSMPSALKRRCIGRRSDNHDSNPKCHVLRIQLRNHTMVNNKRDSKYACCRWNACLWIHSHVLLLCEIWQIFETEKFEVVLDRGREGYRQYTLGSLVDKGC